MIYKIHEARYHCNTKLAASGGDRQTVVELNFTYSEKQVLVNLTVKTCRYLKRKEHAR
jgi:hypothetical protein